MQVEEVCDEFERDGIYDTISNKCAFVVCHYCPDKLKVAINQIKNNLRGNVRTHITSVGHQTNRTQKRMTQYCNSSSRKCLEDFTKPFLAALCLGYRPSEQDGTYVHEMQLMRDFDMSKDYGFFPDMQKRNLYLKSNSDVAVISTSGAFRSILCISTTQSSTYPLAGHCCLRCFRIPKSREYKSLVEIMAEGPKKMHTTACPKKI